MLEQIRTIDKSRLLEYIGHLDCRDMRAVDVSLRISLDMGTDTSGTFWGGEAETGLGSDLSHVAVGVMKKSNLYKMAWF